MARVAVIDDHPIVLQGVAALLAQAGHDLVLSTADPQELRLRARQGGLDLVVLDLNMPQVSGLQLAGELRDIDPGIRLVLLTSGIGALDLSHAMTRGVEGIALKESAITQLVGCVETVLAGQRWYDPELTRRAIAGGTGGTGWTTGGRSTGGVGAGAAEPLSPREAEVVDLVVAGYRNKEIARRLGVTEGTVKTHLHNVYAKLGVTTRTQLAYVARGSG
jgi:two-component system nitrate/nitrite response regulator NarP